MGGKIDDIEVLDSLFAQRAALEAQASVCKEALAKVNAAIAAQTGWRVREAYERAGKTHGTLRFAIGNRIFKTEIDKRVTWDSELLERVAAEMPWADVRALFSISFKIDERKFSDLSDANLRAHLFPARTVKYSEPKISVGV